MSRIADIAAALAGYDPQALSVDGVQAFLAQLVAQAVVSEREEVGVREALGRVLAEDIISPVSVPPHDNSAMDGFAFDGAVLRDDAPIDASIELRVVGTALAGAAWRGSLGAGDAVRIMTGAVMPEGLDTVIPQEFCKVDGDRVSFPAKVLRRGDNRRFAGEDLMQGQPALRRGERLSPAALGMIASLGLPSVSVLRRLRVAYFSTGDEILSLGEPPREGAVYDSNRYTVFGLLTRLGCEVIDLGLVRDDPATLAATLQRAASEADAIITSGGVSVGAADHTRAVMQQLGDMAFWRVAMRPGRPMAVGLIPRNQTSSSQPGAAVLFGLPGNPVAVMVTFLAFVRPALLRMMGCHDIAAAPRPLLRARSVGAIRKKPGRTEYQRGFVTAVAGALPEVRIAGNQGSGVLSSMVEANGLVVLHHDQGSVAAGDEVDVMMLDGLVRLQDPAWSDPAEGLVHALVGEHVGALVARIARVALDPPPFDDVATLRHQLVELLPELHVLYRLLGRGAPALGFPAADPLGDAHAHVLAVEIKNDLAWPLEGGQALDHGREFHAVVGGVEFAAEQFLFGGARLEPRAPATGAGVALARTIGVDHDFVQNFLFLLLSIDH